MDVCLQPSHDSWVLPQGVSPSHVERRQLVQGGRLAKGHSCYSGHSPPACRSPCCLERAHLCTVLQRENTERDHRLPALLFTSTFTSFSASSYFGDKQSREMKVALPLPEGETIHVFRRTTCQGNPDWQETACPESIALPTCTDKLQYELLTHPH